MHALFFICGIVGGCNIICFVLTLVLSTMLDNSKEVIPEAMATLDKMALMSIMSSANLFW